MGEGQSPLPGLHAWAGTRCRTHPQPTWRRPQSSPGQRTHLTTHVCCAPGVGSDAAPVLTVGTAGTCSQGASGAPAAPKVPRLVLLGPVSQSGASSAEQSPVQKPSGAPVGPLRQQHSLGESWRSRDAHLRSRPEDTVLIPPGVLLLKDGVHWAVPDPEESSVCGVDGPPQGGCPRGRW